MGLTTTRTRARSSVGGAFESRGRFYMRVTVATGSRPAKLLPWCQSLADAETRAHAVQALVNQLRQAHEETWIANVVNEGASANADELAALERNVLRIVDGKIERVDAPDDPSAPPTLETFSKRWTSGELHRLYPDHCAAKEAGGMAADVRVFAKHINPLIGSTRIDLVGLGDAELVMSKLPSHMGSAGRRHVAQALRRVLTLAVYPGRLRATNPIPTGWLPKVKRSHAFTFLYPEEDLALMQASNAPLIRRLFFGVLAREGLRRDELALLFWRDVDLKRGMLKLDENKTDDPRVWTLDPSVTRALARWKKRQGKHAKPTDLIFSDGGDPLAMTNAADNLRADLLRAGCDRAELHERSKVRRPLRVHDLRATFVTVSLANEKTEAWVSDRTGHRSSEMINRYRRAARTWAEARLGTFTPLDEAIAWEEPPRGSIRGSNGGQRPSESANVVATSRDSTSDGEDGDLEIMWGCKPPKSSNLFLSATNEPLPSPVGAFSRAQDSIEDVLDGRRDVVEVPADERGVGCDHLRAAREVRVLIERDLPAAIDANGRQLIIRPSRSSQRSPSVSGCRS